jgi:hypothetical protein
MTLFPGMETPQPPSQRLQVRYDTTNAQYASHFMMNTTADELYLDLSSGLIRDPANGGTSIMPIHTRLVLSPGAARRLYSLLGQALNGKPADQAPAS